MFPTQPFAIPEFYSHFACFQPSQWHCHSLCYNKETIKQKQIICDSPPTREEWEAEEENLNFSLFPSSLLCRLYCVTCQIIEIHYSAESGIEKTAAKKKKKAKAPSSIVERWKRRVKMYLLGVDSNECYRIVFSLHFQPAFVAIVCRKTLAGKIRVN